MYVLLLVVTIIAAISSSSLSNYLGKNVIKSSSDKNLYTAVVFFSAFIIYLAITFVQGVSIQTILLGIVFGILNYIVAILSIGALAIGPLYITQLFSMSSTIIPSVSGVLFFNENLSIYKLLFIILLIISVAVTTLKNKDDKKFNFKWLILCIGLFFSVGFVGIYQKIFASTQYGNETAGFLASAFLVTSLISLMKVDYKKVDFKLNKSLILFSIVCGVCTYLNNHINLFLSGKIESQLFFPLVNGVPAISISLISFTVFKEKFSVLQLIGLTCGIISIVMLCLV